MKIDARIALCSAALGWLAAGCPATYVVLGNEGGAGGAAGEGTLISGGAGGENALAGTGSPAIGGYGGAAGCDHYDPASDEWHACVRDGADPGMPAHGGAGGSCECCEGTAGAPCGAPVDGGVGGYPASAGTGGVGGYPASAGTGGVGGGAFIDCNTVLPGSSDWDICYPDGTGGVGGGPADGCAGAPGDPAWDASCGTGGVGGAPAE